MGCFVEVCFFLLCLKWLKVGRMFFWRNFVFAKPSRNGWWEGFLIQVLCKHNLILFFVGSLWTTNDWNLQGADRKILFIVKMKCLTSANLAILLVNVLRCWKRDPNSKARAWWPSTFGDKVWSRLESPGFRVFFSAFFEVNRWSLLPIRVRLSGTRHFLLNEENYVNKKAAVSFRHYVFGERVFSFGFLGRGAGRGCGGVFFVDFEGFKEPMFFFSDFHTFPWKSRKRPLK